MSIQFIKSARPGKPVTWFVYAFKGGPRIRKHVGPRKPVLTAADHAAVAKALAEANARETDKFESVIRAWQRSPEWEAMEASTKKVWRSHIDLIDARWGRFPAAIWDDHRMSAKVLDWRNERKATPRTADIGVTVLRALLKWAKLYGHVALNPATDIPTLYRGNDREEIVWLPEDIEAFEKAAIKADRAHIIDGLRLCALTGMRRQDLVTLTFDHVGEFAVSKTALKKSRGKRRKATIPMTPELEAFLAEMKTRARDEGVNTVLVNSFGKPWSGDGFGGSFNRIRDDADICHVTEDGTRKPKHLHDVRGTFCTMLLAECELTDQQAAEIMAWSDKRVASIRRKYVDGAQVVMAIGQRIAKRGAKQ